MSGLATTPAPVPSPATTPAHEAQPTTTPAREAHLRNRARLVRAMAELIGERGLDELAVREVAERAGTSTTAFRSHFGAKEACLLEVCELAGERLAARVAAAYESGNSWPERVRAAVAELLGALVGNPRLATALIVEVPCLGAAGQRCYRRAIERFLPLLEPGRSHCDAAEALSSNVERLALAGAEAVIVGEVAAGRLRHLEQMAPEVLFALLVPYLGPRVVAAQVRQPPVRQPPLAL